MNGMCVIHLGAIEKGVLIAFDLKSGKQKWQCASDGASYSSLSIMTIDGKKQLVDLTDKNLVGVDPGSGKLLWQFAAPVAGMVYNAPTPVIDGQTVIITGGGQGTKAVKIEKQGNEFVAKELWKNPDVGTKFNSPILKDGFLYGLSTARKLYCMNAATGQTVWIDDKIQNDGEIVDTGNLLIAITQNSNLIAFKPDEKAYTEVALIKVSDTPVFAYPILAKDNIYIKDKETLAMMSVK
jgi:outer membrane protein assembly factor BamB